MEQVRHHPAMAEVVLDCLQVKSDGVYVDATVGLGGHSELILQKLGPDGRLICIDRDEIALSMAIFPRRHPGPWRGRFKLMAVVMQCFWT